MKKTTFLLLAAFLLSGSIVTSTNSTPSTNSTASTLPARPNRDYALFFAVNDYQPGSGFDDLSKPIENAEAVAKELRERYAFQTEVVKNPTAEHLLCHSDGIRPLYSTGNPRADRHRPRGPRCEDGFRQNDKYKHPVRVSSAKTPKTALKILTG